MNQREVKYHGNSLGNKLIDYWNTKKFTDVSLVCDGEVVRAHKLVLAAASPLFETAFATQTENVGCVIIFEISKHVLLLLLEAIYKGTLLVHRDLIPSMIQAANKLQVTLSCEDNDVNENVSDAILVNPNLSPIIVADMNPTISSTDKTSLQNDLPAVESTRSEIQGDVNMDNSHKSSERTNVDNASSVHERSSERNKMRTRSIRKDNSEDKWLSAVRTSSRKRRGEVLSREKKVVNPFARKCHNDNDFTINDTLDTIKEEQSSNMSVSDNDSDVQVIVTNTSVVEVHDSNVMPLSSSDTSDISQRRTSSRTNNSDVFKNDVFTSDESELLPSTSTKRKKALKKQSGNSKITCKVMSPSGTLNTNPVESAAEPFEAFLKMPVRELLKFCLICKKNTKNLSKHVDVQHSQQNNHRYVCKVCSKKFYNSEFIDLHVCKPIQ